MDDTRELKQAYDIFTAAWRIYKAYRKEKSPRSLGIIVTERK